MMNALKPAVIPLWIALSAFCITDLTGANYSITGAKASSDQPIGSRENTGPVYFQGQDAAWCEGDVILSSQIQIDLFCCTEVQGDLTISGSDITNLNGLNGLVYIEGHLNIRDNPSLETIDGFCSLKKVGLGIDISSNAVLAALDGFNVLDTVTCITGRGAISISYNPSLLRINGFTSLTTTSVSYFSIDHNDNLAGIQGFSSLTSLRGNVAAMLSIRDNPVLQNIDGFANLSEIAAEYSAKCQVANNDALRDVNGLSSLKALSSMNAVLDISENESLNHIDALSSLTTLGVGRPGRLALTNNPRLIRCCGIFPLLSNKLPYTLEISGNGSGCTKDDILAGRPCPAIYPDDVTLTAFQTEAGASGASAVLLYPNPGNGNFNLVIQNTYTGAFRVQIHSMEGKVIRETVRMKENPVYQEHFDLNALPKGMYMLSIMYYGNTSVTYQKLLRII